MKLDVITLALASLQDVTVGTVTNFAENIRLAKLAILCPPFMS